MRASVIDLGFNSVKMVNYAVDPQGEYRAYEQSGFRVKLGEGLNEMGLLGDEPVRRTIGRLKVFRDIIDLQSIGHVLPVATSAVREAANRYQFLRTVRAETGLQFKVLSSEEEALYSYAGAAGFLGLPDVVFFDIGGGSLEMVRAKDFNIKRVLSLPLGALRMTYAYSKGDGSFSKAGLARMKDRVVELMPNREELKVGERTLLVGVGGTLRALARYDQALRGYPFNKVHNYRLPFDSVDSISEAFLPMSRRELAKVNPVSNRAETIAAGSFVIRTMMKRLGFRSVIVSTHGLREGTLAMFLNDSRAFRTGRVDPFKVEKYVTNGRGVRSRISRGTPLAFMEAGLIDEHQSQILTEAQRLHRMTSPTTDLQALFFSMLGEDSPYSHSEQLLMALLVVAAGNERASEFLLDEYKPLLERPSRKSISRLSAASAFSEAVSRAEATIRLSRRRRRLVIRFYRTGKALPGALLRSHAVQLGEAFDLNVVPVFGRGVTDVQTAQVLAMGGRSG